jgi:hypothetical protein
MNEAKPGTIRDADLAHLKEYLDNLATVTEIAVAAGADVKIYNSLCDKLNAGSGDRSNRIQSLA